MTGRPPADTGWIATTTVRAGPGPGVAAGLALLALALLAVLAAVAY